eukprot:7048578-Pyramimonas_sp.AAC.1
MDTSRRGVPFETALQCYDRWEHGVSMAEPPLPHTPEQCTAISRLSAINTSNDAYGSTRTYGVRLNGQLYSVECQRPDVAALERFVIRPRAHAPSPLSATRAARLGRYVDQMASCLGRVTSSGLWHTVAFLRFENDHSGGCDVTTWQVYSSTSLVTKRERCQVHLCENGTEFDEFYGGVCNEGNSVPWHPSCASCPNLCRDPPGSWAWA